MNHIVVNLLGVPTVQLNGGFVHFPYNKSAGFFYYICIKKIISREEAINIFWAGNDEKSARKNLRDVIYKIKKLFGEDILEIEGNTLIKLNENFSIEIDIDAISLSNITEKYSGEFLSHFYIKNCFEFETWCDEMRAYYKELYISELYKRLCLIVDKKDVQEIKKYASILIQNDIYDERMYREIMQIYLEHGHYNLAIKTYYELKEVLHEDLEESPAKETQDVFQKILEIKESSENNSLTGSEYFYGRFEEIYQANSHVKQFASGNSCSILILGEAGVGKSLFLKKVVSLIDEEKVAVLKYSCHYSEKDFYLKLWYGILEQLGAILEKEQIQDDKNSLHNRILKDYLKHKADLSELNDEKNIESDQFTKFRMVAISETLNKLTKQRKVVLVIDDIQWLDDASIKLLNSLLLELGSERLMMIATCRDDHQERLNYLIISLERENLLRQIFLERFSFDETKKILEDLIPPNKFDTELANNVYHDTEGNALFLMELIKVVKDKGYSKFLSSKAINIIKSRLIDLSEDEQEVLNAISLFQNRASMSDLKIFFPMVELEIFEIIEKLTAKKMITEEAINGDVFFSFNHQRIQEYIHERQSIGKRKVLHRKIAESYEKDFLISKKNHLYSKLIYHFNECQNAYKTCFYRLQYLKDHSYIVQEIFPHLSESAHHDNYEDFAGENIKKLAEDIENSFDTSPEYLELQMQMCFVIGRHHIYTGNYDEGLKKIDESSIIAKSINNYEYIFNNYKQMVYYGVQVSDIGVMKKYLDLCEETLDKCPKAVEEKPQILRLQGLYLIETGATRQAQEKLFKTIDLLISLPRTAFFSADLAVCYNYLGRSYFLQKNNETALMHFIKAIDLCEKKYVTNGMGIFYSDAAQVLFEMARYKEAKEYSIIANNCFHKTNALWGRAKAEIYAALIELKLGNVEQAQCLFTKAQKTSIKLSNPQNIQQIADISKEYGQVLNG